VEAAMKVVAQRMTATVVGDEPDGGFVVFLIGMRVNKWWKVHRWLPIARAMLRMLDKLSQHPELGLLGTRMVLDSRGPTFVQYWRSTEHLVRFAGETDYPHPETWRWFNRRIGTNGDVGIWHETYVVAAGGYEVIYENMPPFGLAAAGEYVPIQRRGETARERLAGG
jgi:hypothetical protein